MECVLGQNLGLFVKACPLPQILILSGALSPMVSANAPLFMFICDHHFDEKKKTAFGYNIIMMGPKLTCALDTV